MILSTDPINNIGTDLNSYTTTIGIGTDTTTTTTITTNTQSSSSSPPPAKTKRNRSDGCSRINGSLSLNDIIKSLIKRRQNGQFNEKPPYSYAILICLAILQSTDGKLTLSQIYHWISSHFPYFQLKDSSWQNSIRHNLSLNDGFIKTAKSSDGKGHFWQVKETSAQKFFKHETRSYEEIRDKLKHLDQYIFSSSSSSSSSPVNDSVDLNDSTTLIENNSLPIHNPLRDPLTLNLTSVPLENNNTLYNDNKEMNPDGFDNGDDDNNEKNMTPLIQVSSPPQYNSNDNDDFIDRFESESSSPNQQLANIHNSSDFNTTHGFQATVDAQQPSDYKNFIIRTPILHDSSTFHENFTPIQDSLPNQLMLNNLNNNNNNHYFFSFSSDSTSPTRISPNNNFKKYFYSFNSNFDISPIKNDNNININIQESNNSFNVKTNSSQLSINHQPELFKTPELRRSQSFESVSRQIFNTPRYEQFNEFYKTNHITTTTTTNNNNVTNKDDQGGTTNSENQDNIALNDNNNKNNSTDLIMKYWKTPSHLFEDIYSSPIMKAMGKTPVTKISSTPNGTIIRTFSPRNLSTPNLLGNYTPTTTTTSTIKTKLSSGGLFGVDLYSVWERALKDFNCSKYKTTDNEKVNSNSKNEKLDLPFMSQSQPTKSPQNRF